MYLVAQKKQCGRPTGWKSSELEVSSVLCFFVDRKYCLRKGGSKSLVRSAQFLEVENAQEEQQSCNFIQNVQMQWLQRGREIFQAPICFGERQLKEEAIKSGTG
jgi:hypothetical protein